jgi:hypothetical protein
MPQADAERYVGIIAKHGVEAAVAGTSLSLGLATLLAYHSGAVMLGNERPRTCVLVRPKGYAQAWCESVDAARAALRTPRHRTEEPPEESQQLDLFGAS